MAVIDFPAGPIVGQIHTTANGLTYTWDGDSWLNGTGSSYTRTEEDARFVNVTGDTMSGDLILPAAAPTVPAQAANKQYVDDKSAVSRPRLTQLERNTVQTATNSVDMPVSWNVELLDEVNAWVVGSPTRITVPAGYTQMRISVAVITWTANATGPRYFSIKKNGSTNIIFLYSTPIAAQPITHLARSRWLTVTTGDYFEAIGFQGSGGNLDTLATVGQIPMIEIEWLP